MTNLNKIKTIAFLVGTIAILAIVYFVAGNWIKNMMHPVPTSTTIPQKIEEPATSLPQSNGELKQYTNTKYGFSFTYLSYPNFIIEETESGVLFLGCASCTDFFRVDVEPTKFSDPSEEVVQTNKLINKQGFEQFIDKHISIDGYPAIVTYESNIGATNGDVYPDRKVLFIKDKLLFTISTLEEDDALWNSFKFTK